MIGGLDMARIPKYKTDAMAAYRHSKKNGRLAEQDETVFLSNPEVAIHYALDVKRERLSEQLENRVCEHYCKIAAATKKLDQSSKMNIFFKYIRLVEEIPKKYEDQFLENLLPENLHLYTAYSKKRLPPQYEIKMLEKAMKHNNIWPLVEYQHNLKTKLPEELHNFFLAKSLESPNNQAVLAYFLNMKELKKELIKIASGFDKNISLQEAIDQL